ncbi:MAG: rhodanese-like domain-containing protein [Actinobacteria bacterium]|nr:rhodanese-like domain-containing protein [Actinomycetota bacterium]
MSSLSKYVVVAAILVSMAYIVGCSSDQTVAPDPGVSRNPGAPQTQQRAAYQNIDAAKAKELIDSDTNLQIIDVREEYEFAEGYITGAKLIPIGQFTSRMNEIDKNKPVLVYCAVGSRSASAAEVLAQSGYTNVYNFGAGMGSWPYETQR